MEAITFDISAQTSISYSAQSRPFIQVAMIFMRHSDYLGGGSISPVLIGDFGWVVQPIAKLN